MPTNVPAIYILSILLLELFTIHIQLKNIGMSDDQIMKISW